MIGLVGRKRGMTRIFDENGKSVPVTVIEVEPNRVVERKQVDTDGYNALQVTTGQKRATRVNAPIAGHYKKAGVEAGRGLWEMRLPEGASWPAIQVNASGGDAEGDSEEVEVQVGSELTVKQFTEGQIVDVVGRTIGKGYAGAIKRHNFRAQRSTHGNSKAHRAPGSIGQNQSPGHVFKGKKMSGHMGDSRATVQNLRVVRVDAERNILLVQGGVPGAKGGDVIVRPAVKHIQ